MTNVTTPSTKNLRAAGAQADVSVQLAEWDLYPTNAAAKSPKPKQQPQDRTRIPDFGVIIYDPERDPSEVMMLAVEVKPLLKSNFDVVQEDTETTDRFLVVEKSVTLMQQTFEQAQMVFLRYPYQKYVHVLLVVGAQCCFLRYSRASTPALVVDHDSASYNPDNKSEAEKPTKLKYMTIPKRQTEFFNILDLNGQDYSSDFKDNWTAAKKDAFVARKKARSASANVNSTTAVTPGRRVSTESDSGSGEEVDRP